jgi:PAS domain S-box-containing protein
MPHRMIALDFRTVFIGHTISTILCAGVISALWFRNLRRSPGVVFWVADFWLQSLALVLILLRGAVPDLLSMAVANTLVVAGLLLLLMGLERYLGRVGKHVHNYAFLAVFFVAHTYFSVVQPSLMLRNVNASVGLVYLCSQTVWLLWHRVDRQTRSDAVMAIIVFGSYAVLAAIRIAWELTMPVASELFQSGLFETLVILAYQMLQIGLTFSLVLLVNRRLMSELERDIKERNVAEEALGRSEAKFSTAFHTSPDAVNINRLSDGLFLDVNEGFTGLTGYTPEDVAGKGSQDIAIWVDPADRGRLIEGLQADGVVLNLEAEFRRKDGSVITGLMSARVVDVAGEQCILSVTRDISERRNAEIALRESEERFRVLFDSATDGIFLLDSRGTIVTLNAAFAEMHGYSVEEMLTMDLMDLDTPELARLVPARLERLFAGERLTIEVEHFRKEGGTIPLEVSANLVVIGDEKYVLGFHRDITKRRQAEAEIVRLNQDLEERVQERTEELTATNEELVDANVRLDEATRAKSDFLASMSHELRTPLNSIIGFSDILARGMAGPLEPEQEKQVRMIYSSGRHLLELVNEVLDLTSVESGKMKIEHSPLDIPEVLSEVVESLAPLAAEKQLGLAWQVSPDAASIVSDRTRLEQVLFNILGNAIKFTDSGSVRIDVSRVADDVVFVFTDTGRGIAHKDLHRVFDEFYQAERHDVAKSEGTGLGLTVSKRLLDLLGGTIEVESTLGEGSTFTVRLPAGA